MLAFFSLLILSLIQHFEYVFMKSIIQRVRFHILLLLIIKHAYFNKFLTERIFKLHFPSARNMFLAQWCFTCFLRYRKLDKTRNGQSLHFVPCSVLVYSVTSTQRHSMRASSTAGFNVGRESKVNNDVILINKKN